MPETVIGCRFEERGTGSCRGAARNHPTTSPGYVGQGILGFEDPGTEPGP